MPGGLKYFALVAACVAAGAFLMVWPFLREQEAAAQLAQQDNLAGTLDQIRQLQAVGGQIAAATAQWTGIQEAAGRTVGTAGQLLQDMRTERESFSEFLRGTNDQHKQAMGLELEKLHRSHQEILQVVVHLLDHTYALYLAGSRSGQPALAQQLGNFRAACLDATRRLGLVAHEAQPGEAFDPQKHQTRDGSAPAEGVAITETVACGYTFQGTPLRRIVVSVGEAAAEAPAPEA